MILTEEQKNLLWPLLHQRINDPSSQKDPDIDKYKALLNQIESNPKGYPMLQMLDMSTGHLTRETIEFLEDNCELMLEDRSLVVYKKDCYGFLIPVNSESISDQLPRDLFNVLKYAESRQAEWLMLDSDGHIFDDLEFFEW